jgi:hypothetical protein
LKEQAATDNTTNKEFGTLSVIPELSLHFI